MTKQKGTVEKITNGGWGLVRGKEGVVFLSYVLPGEEVEYRIKDKAKGILWGEVTQVTSPSPHRVEPPCPYFGQCGGCVFQHIEFKQQEIIKQNILCDDLKRIGHFHFDESFPMPRVITSPAFGNRARARMKGFDDGRIGFIRKGTTTILPIEKCLLFPDEINRFIKEWNEQPNPPFFHQMDIFLNHSTRKPYIHLSHPPKKEKDVLNRFPYVTFSWKGNEDAAVSRLNIKDHAYHVSPSVFFQVNPFQWKHMLDVTETFVKPGAPYDTAIDLYCGVGFFIPLLQKYATNVTGVESAPFSVNLAKRSFPDAEFYKTPAEKFKFPFAGLLLVDPPRSGLSKHVMSTIKHKKFPRLVYISCSSATFSRDLKALKEIGYQCKDIAVFDLFPQTAHLETISLFTLP